MHLRIQPTMSERTPWYPLACALLCAGGALMSGCGKEDAPKAKAALTEVTVAAVTSGDVPRVLDTVGNIAAVNTVDVRARVEGYLIERGFTEGDLVEKDALLYVIDPKQFQAAVTEYEGRLASAQAVLDKASRDVRRYHTLVAKGDVSRETYDTFVEAERKAKADVKTESAALDQARLNLGYTRITAPVAGRIGKTEVNVGNLVGAAGVSKLATIVQVDPIYVYFSPSADHLPTITAAQKDKPLSVNLVLSGETAYPHPGTVDFIDTTVDPTTNTIKLRAVVPNPDGALLPGEFAQVRLHAGTRADSLQVPQEALKENQDGFLVYVVDDKDTVDTAAVQTGPAYENKRIITSGLKAGDRVIVSGVQHVKPGDKVAPRTAGAAGN